MEYFFGITFSFSSYQDPSRGVSNHVVILLDEGDIHLVIQTKSFSFWVVLNPKVDLRDQI